MHEENSYDVESNIGQAIIHIEEPNQITASYLHNFGFIFLLFLEIAKTWFW